jgi:tRNA (guanine-N7-)-methyltransferase
MSAADRAALRDLVPSLLVAPVAGPVDWSAVFGRHAPLIVEIGFGSGETVAANAHLRPEADIVAVDIHTPGFATLARALEARGSTNVRIVDADAIDVLQWMFTEQSVDTVTTYFPDPWRKPGQHHRRLIQADVARLVATRLQPGGTWRIATDWEDYAHDIVAVVANEPLLHNPYDASNGSDASDTVSDTGDSGDPADGRDASGFAPREAERPITKFEGRALREGRTIRTVLATRIT